MSSAAVVICALRVNIGTLEYHSLCEIHFMVYLKSLYSKPDWLAKRQSIHYCNEAKQEHVKIYFLQMSYTFIKKDQD